MQPLSSADNGSYAYSPQHRRFDSYPPVDDRAYSVAGARRWTPRGVLLIIGSALLVLFICGSAAPPTTVLEKQLGGTRLGDFLMSHSSPAAESPAELESICPECNCSMPGSFSLSPRFSSVALPTLQEARHPRAAKRTIKRYLSSETQQFLWLHPELLPETATSRLFTSWLTCPDNLISLNFQGLAHGKPTLYMYTRTGDGGRLKATERRLKYFLRHEETVKQYWDLVREGGYSDPVAVAQRLQPEDRQLIWILIEDGDHINPTLDTQMRSSGIPYLYFAHGPTNFYGNAQWNAAERAVHVLRDTFFGDGPVLNVDDDSKVMPELLRRIWKVQRATLFQVGNLGGDKSLWEGPIFQGGKVKDWIVGGLPNRLFPIDMGGFSINSSVIGDGRPVHPPRYIPANDFGGESEFLAQIMKSRDDIEPLCPDSATEKCRFVWHNWMDDPKANLPA